jgi:hypothetical protein
MHTRICGLQLYRNVMFLPYSLKWINKYLKYKNALNARAYNVSVESEIYNGRIIGKLNHLSKFKVLSL